MMAVAGVVELCGGDGDGVGGDDDDGSNCGAVDNNNKNDKL